MTVAAILAESKGQVGNFHRLEFGGIEGIFFLYPERSPVKAELQEFFRLCQGHSTSSAFHCRVEQSP